MKTYVFYGTRTYLKEIEYKIKANNKKEAIEVVKSGLEEPREYEPNCYDECEETIDYDDVEVE